MVPGTLYVVATPLGNLSDLSDRARAVLAEVDLIACEDTRHSGRLLDHFGIGTRKLSLHEHNESERSRRLVEALEAGQSVALISDAGTPLISDPGFVLVRAVRSAGHPVCPVPGPSALIAALSAAGLPSDRFAFEGFLPARKAARRQRIEVMADYSGTLIYYESPHRLTESVKDLTSGLGENRPAVLAAELTKRYERFFDGSLADLSAALTNGTIERRGEWVIMVAGAEDAPSAIEEAAVAPDALIAALLAEGVSPRSIVAALVTATGQPRNAVYRRVMALRDKS